MLRSRALCCAAVSPVARAVAEAERRSRGQGSKQPKAKTGQRGRLSAERALSGSAAAADTAAAPAPALEAQAQVGSTPQRSISVLNKYRALLLDSTYRPVGVANWQRAICLDLTEKVDVLDYYDATCRSAQDEFFLPAVMRVRTHRSKHQHAVVSLNRANLLLRDGYRCQYCGSGPADLTLDHIIPQSKGGGNTWENLVACCTDCNGRKGDKSLERLGWRLRKQPKEPSVHELDFLLAMLCGSTNKDLLPPEWQTYILPFTSRKKQQRAA